MKYYKACKQTFHAENTHQGRGWRGNQAKPIQLILRDMQVS